MGKAYHLQDAEYPRLWAEQLQMLLKPGILFTFNRMKSLPASLGIWGLFVTDQDSLVGVVTALDLLRVVEEVG